MGILKKIFKAIFRLGKKSHYDEPLHLPPLRHSAQAKPCFNNLTPVHQYSTTGSILYAGVPYSGPSLQSSTPYSGRSTYVSPEQACYIHQHGRTVGTPQTPSMSSSVYSRGYYDHKSFGTNSNYDDRSWRAGSAYISLTQERIMRQHGRTKGQNQTPSMTSSVYSRAYDDQRYLGANTNWSSHTGYLPYS
jgi:hypothetical protein